MKTRRAVVAALFGFSFACEARRKPAGPPAVDPDQMDAEFARVLAEVDPVLRYERVPIADEKNAFPLWQEAAEKLERVPPLEPKLLRRALDEEEPFPGGAEGRLLSEWIAANERALELFDAGIAREWCQFPQLHGFDFDLPYLAPLRAAGRLKLAKAKLLGRDGRFDAAAEEIAGIVRLSELFAGGEGPLICSLVAIAVQDHGMSGARWLARQGEVKAGVLEKLVTALDATAGPGYGIADAVRMEFWQLVPGLRQPDELLLATLPDNAVSSVFGELYDTGELDMARYLHADPRLWDPADTLRVAGRLYAHVVNDALVPWTERDTGRRAYWERFHDFAEDEVYRLASAFSDEIEKGEDISDEDMAEVLGPSKNPVGRYNVVLLAPALYAACDRSSRALADREITKAVLALRVYELRHGELPPDLDALVVDGILAKSPADPYSRGALRYDRAARKVWSIGEDGKDDGGDATDEDGNPNQGWWWGKDFVQEVRPPAVK